MDNNDVTIIVELLKQQEKQFSARFDKIDSRFAEMDRRFSDIDRRFEQVDKRLDTMSASVDRRLDAMSASFDKNLDEIKYDLRMDKKKLDAVYESRDKVTVSFTRAWATASFFIALIASTIVLAVAKAF